MTVSAGSGRAAVWVEIRTQNFVIQGDASDADLLRTVDDLEVFRHALSTLYPGRESSHPTRVVIFKDRKEFRRFLPRDAQGRPQTSVSGFFLPAPDLNFIVFAEGDPRLDRRVVLHEYAHHIMRRAGRPLPLWLNEGLAEFFSTFDHDSPLAPAILGRPPGDVLATLRSSEFVPLRTIVNTNSVGDVLADTERARVYYAESWALVHYLTVGRPGATRAQMTALMDALARAMPPDEAFVHAYGTTLSEIESQLRPYVKREVFRGLPIDPGPVPPANAAATPMSDGAIAALRGELLLRVGTRDEAARELRASLAAEPSRVDARVAIARLMNAEGDRAGGRRELEAAAAAAPDDFAAQYYLGGMLAAQRNYFDAFRCFDRAVRLRSDSVSALFAFSSVALALGLDDASDEALRLSMELELNPDAYRARAYAALGLGRDDAAARDALRYAETIGWRQSSAYETALVAVVAYMHVNRPEQATAVLKRILGAAAEGSWASAIAQFLKGTLPADALLARAKNPRERTAAHTYIGLAAAMAGRQDEALMHFRWVKDQGTPQELGYGVAIEELVRLVQGQPNLIQ